jgi:hypothetical protein
MPVADLRRRQLSPSNESEQFQSPPHKGRHHGNSRRRRGGLNTRHVILDFFLAQWQ